MNIQRFTAPTAREALSKARMTFGDGTLILSNRPTSNGIEVVATGEDTLAELDRNEPAPRASKLQSTGAMHSSVSPVRANPSSNVVDDATQLAMSTLSFQDYVRERMLRRRQEAINPAQRRLEPSNKSSPQTVKPWVAPAPMQINLGEPTHLPEAPVTLAAAPVAAPVAKSKSSTASAMPQGIANELHAMKTMIEERFNTLTWLGQARQNPIHANLMLKLIRCGFSPSLSRTILERMPENMAVPDAMRWIMDILTRNVRTDVNARAIEEEGGIYALIGATGVGKTTTAAKLAGLCAQTHGANSVGLITLDTYRVGAHEQLRSYGRMLGVVAHLAHDRAALQDLLGLLSAKKMVLIDTTGIAPSDHRKQEMLDVIDMPAIHRLLVINAAGHGDSIEDVVTSFKGTGTQQAVLSKVDEAAKVGPALDAVIRHQLLLRGITTGQKVPEDWERAEAERLIALSMRAQNKSAFDPKVADLGFIFADSTSMNLGQIHA